MKTDYRVICCIVAWLCCAAVDCRKDTSDWDNFDGNGIQDFGREYDGDIFDVLGKAYNADKDVKQEDEPDEVKCKETCGDGYSEKGITCTSDKDVVKCTCGESKGFDSKNKACKACDCGEEGVASCSFDDEGVQTACVCKETFALKAGKCEVCSCGDGFKSCTFGDDDKEVCVCNEGYALKKDGKCAVCSCGDGSKPCTFGDDDKEVCVCNEGYALKKDRKCAVCNCGTGAVGCNFDEADNIKCDCKDKYSQKNGKCEACDCGDNAESCHFEGTSKVCICQENHGQKDGNCTVCDCGDGAKTCKFQGTNQICYCKENYGLNKDKKCAACDCGEGVSSCSFDDKGVQKCVCKNKFSLKNDGKCHDCDCGAGSNGCKFDGEQKVCACKDGYADKDGTCTACKCGGSSSGCKFENDKKTCDCKSKYGDKNGTCVACDCGNDATGCSFDGDEKTCKCIDKSADKKGKCEKCNCGGSVSTGCSFKDTNKTCVCVKDYADNNGICSKDYCQIKCGCGVESCGDEVECEGTDKFKESDVTCACTDEKKFDDSLKKCRTPCEIKDNKHDCENGAQCGADKFCKCLNGTFGDTCAEVTACAKGGKYAECKDDKGTCGYDAKSQSPVCSCDAGKELDNEKNYCVDKFCLSGNCGDNSKCEFDKETLTGYCVCPKGKYYDYQANRCKGPDKCLLKKTACKENEECVDGECKCPYEKDGEKCIRKFCKPGACFSGAKCNEEDGSCTCEEGKIFTGSRCEDKKCILDDDYEEKCKSCPRQMDRNGTKCVPKSGKLCDKDCGLGLCVNDYCRCFEGAELINKICVLKKSVCASGKLVNGSSSQCQCDDKYKQAKDGKTCQLVTCDDEYAKNFCAQRGATCTMKWTGPSPKFDCECPKGYVMDNDRDICTDPCSLQKNIDTCLRGNMFCFNSISKANLLTGDCRCPPPFSNANLCDVLDKNVHLISGIPVVKKNYEMKNGVNHVLLNSHLTQSLAQTYSSAVFDYGYLYDYEVQDSEIICSVWVRFKQNASEQLQRVPFQAKQFTDVCEDCDTSMYVWPPSLLVSENGLDKVLYEDLDLCSTAVKDRLCGKEADCNAKTGCFCPRGFRMLEYTARLTADGRRTLRCEATSKNDLDECKAGTHSCPKNTVCLKVPGDYICQCKPGYWKENNNDRKDCQDWCTKKPCKKGKCLMKKDTFNCECEAGYAGSVCDEKDVNFASAKKSTVVVGSVLGTILIVGIIAFLLYYRKIRKSTYSEDFMPAPTLSHAEMTERRPMRGVVNKSYE